MSTRRRPIDAFVAAVAGVPLILAWACTSVPSQGEAEPPRESTETLRVDFHHGGTSTVETFALERMTAMPGWAGASGPAIDDLGSYRVVLVDEATGETRYSRGYCTIFEEWRTTADARARRRVFRESVLVPMPVGRARVELHVRDGLGRFTTAASFDVDPRGRDVHRYATPARTPRLIRYRSAGAPADKVDLAVVAEGYRRDEIPRFERDAAALVDALFAIEPFRSRRDDFNVTLVAAVSEESGLDRPRRRRFVRTAVESTFDALGIARYILVEDQHRLMDVCAGVPHDLVAVVVNTAQYGGGGIYNWQLTCGARHPRAASVFAHEFGHLLGGLADEYYQSEVTYEDIYPAGVEPWQPNITRLLDPAALKWRRVVTPGTPIPTPWPKRRYEDPRTADPAGLLRDDPNFGRIGAFEGAGYSPHGIFRPSLDCIMFSGSADGYCRVCRDALERAIDRLVGDGGKRTDR